MRQSERSRLARRSLLRQPNPSTDTVTSQGESRDARSAPGSKAERTIVLPNDRDGIAVYFRVVRRP
jgi:hypothetical protein